MDLKSTGNVLYVLGMTRRELGGSLWAEVHGQSGGIVPRVDLANVPGLLRALHEAMRRGLIRSCHDLSEGGLAVALAEMALAGGLGVAASLEEMPCADDACDEFTLLFSESPTRFVLEVAASEMERVEDVFRSWPLGRLGVVGGVVPGRYAGDGPPRLTIMGHDLSLLVDAPLDQLRDAWQRPLRWS
jgi:phosphoribosylformylglycinamidine synthase